MSFLHSQFHCLFVHLLQKSVKKYLLLFYQTRLTIDGWAVAVFSQDFATPNSDGQTCVISTRKHQSIEKLFEGVKFAFGEIGCSSCDILLENTDFDDLSGWWFVEFGANLKCNEKSHDFS